MSYSEFSDKHLVAKLKKGDIKAFDQLFIKYAGKINLLAKQYLGTKEDAEGLTQDVFIKIWKKRESIKTEHSFRSYIFSIVFNDIKKFYRDKHMILEPYNDFAHDKQTNNTISEISYNEIVKQLEIELNKLTPRQKEIFILSREQGLSHKEISNKLNISTKTVENHLHSATKQIKKHLEKAGFLYIIFITLFL